MRIVRRLVIALDVVLGIALILTAYAGYVSPIKHGGIWGVFALLFTPMALASSLFLLIQLFCYRRGAIVTAASMLACAGPLLTFCPLHILPAEAPADAETFTLLSYNVHQFLPPHENANPEGASNPQLEFILHADADIVCLQETDLMVARRPNIMSQQQRQRLFDAYEYVYLTDAYVTLCSKYPVEPLHLDDKKLKMCACYRITLPSGRKFTLFNVHMQSMCLGENGAQTYHDLTKGKAENIDTLRTQLLDKIENAAVARAQETQELLRAIRLYGGPDVIIAGDFNDVPGCYSLRTLADAGFISTYPKVGFGPIITYNDSGIMVCIDHILYRGDFIPLAFRRTPLRASDHYPIVARFVLPARTP